MSGKRGETGQTPQPEEALKVFISYSRAQVAFADDLALSLRHNGHEVIIDRTDIQYGEEDFQNRLRSMIEACGTVVFVLTDESANSDICLWETETAKALGKRTLVVTLGDLSEGTAPPPALSKINWVHCWRNPAIPGSSQAKGFIELDTALRADIGWLTRRTSYQERALNWVRRGSDPDSPILLRGVLLEEAMDWSRATPAEETVPQEIAAFITASEAHENKLTSDARKQARAVLRVGLTVGVFALGFMALAAFFWWRNFQQSYELDDRAIDLAEARSAEFAQEAHRMYASDIHFQPFAMVMALYGGPKTFNYGLKPKLLERANFSAIRNALSHMIMRNKIIYVTEEGSDDVNSVAFDLTGQRFVSVHYDSIVLWQTDKLQSEEYLLIEDSEIYSVAFHPDGQRIATAHDDGATRIWRLGESEPLETFLVEGSVVYSVAFHPDGQRIATAHDDGAARIWRLGQSEPLETFLVEDSEVHSVAFHPDGQRIATAHDDGSARIWRLGKVNVEETFSIDDREISIVAFHPDGARLVTGHADGARVWRLGEADPKQVLSVDSIEDAGVFSAAFHEDSDRIFTGHGNGEVRIWQLGRGTPEPLRPLDANLNSIVEAIAVHPSGTKLVAGYEGLLAVWDIDDFKPENRYELPEASVKSIAINSRNERFVITEAGLIGRWQPEQQELEPVFELTDAPLYRSAFQPNGQRVVALHSDGIARLWKIGQTEPIASYDVAGSGIVALAIHSGGQQVATAHYDGFIRLWSMGQSEPTAELFYEDPDKYGLSNGITSIAFHHDGERIITGHASGFIQVWHIGRELPVEAFRSTSIPRFYRDSIETVSVHPDGEIFISVSRYGHAALWRFGNREPEYEFQLENSDRHTLAFDSQGNRLTIVFADGMVEEWQIPEVATAKLERQIELVCAKLSEMSVPTAFPISSASSYRSLRDVPVDSNNPDFLIDPCTSQEDPADSAP